MDRNYSIKLFGFRYQTNSPGGLFMVAFYSMIIVAIACFVMAIITLGVGLNFTLRVIEAETNAPAWLNPGNVLGYLAVFLAFIILAAITRLVVTVVTAIITIVSAGLGAIVDRERGAFIGAIFAVAISSLLLAFAIAFGVVAFFDYSGDHWSHLTGIFLHDSYLWMVLFILFIYGSLSPTQVKND